MARRTASLPQPRRVAIRLTPFEARQLERLRCVDRAPGEERSATEVIVALILAEAKRLGDEAGE